MKRICNGVRLLQLPVAKYRGDSRIIYLFTYVAFFVWASIVLTALYAKKRYDIIQVHTMPDFLVFTALFPKILGARVILDVHDLTPELYMSKFRVEKTHPSIRFVTWIERTCIAFADSAIAVHVPHRDVLVRHGNPKERFTIVLNLPDPNVFGRAQTTRRIPDGKFRLIHHGTIAKRQGLEIAIRAVALAKKSVHNIEFSIIGTGDDCERLICMVDEMKLGAWVKLTNKSVPLDELPRLISQADVAVVPILQDPFTRYQLPVKVLEYFWLGIPVISSRSETLDFYFDDTMISYFKSGNEAELADRILDLYNNPKKRGLLASNAMRFNEEFNWDKQKMAYYELIDSLLPTTKSKCIHHA